MKDPTKPSTNNFTLCSLAFGLGCMIYNGMELGNFFEIPWNSPCYQVLRGINPILQMVFTFSQMYFVFMNARVKKASEHIDVIQMSSQFLFIASVEHSQVQVRVALWIVPCCGHGYLHLDPNFGQGVQQGHCHV